MNNWLARCALTIPGYDETNQTGANEFGKAVRSKMAPGQLPWNVIYSVFLLHKEKPMNKLTCIILNNVHNSLCFNSIKTASPAPNGHNINNTFNK